MFIDKFSDDDESTACKVFLGKRSKIKQNAQSVEERKFVAKDFKRVEKVRNLRVDKNLHAQCDGFLF